MPVAEMLERMSSAEVTEWAAFYQLRRKEEEKAHKEAEIRSKSTRRR